MQSNTTRIAKNTLMLYFRQILIMLVSLYTVRVVLETLGAEDYGIYNVVAGVVTMFGFLSNSMAIASQRYFSFEIGREDSEQLKRIFSLSLIIYALIALIILILAETIGLWFVSNKLVILLERKNMALWVYQLAIVSFIFTIFVSPYMALIFAFEDMDIFAYVSIGEALLKLGSVFILQVFLWDKLLLYGLLLCLIAFIKTVVYWWICKIKYKECKFQFFWDRKLFKEFTGYTAWNFFGELSGVINNQSISILLNQFFNPAVVASRSIAFSVRNTAMSFSQNFFSAIRPQIVKKYAAGQKTEMLLLMFQGAKGAYFLMYLVVMPLIIEMPFVLSLWLGELPAYLVVFTRLVLFDVLIDSVNYPLVTAAQATGRIKLYQMVVGGISLARLPISWIILLQGAPAYSVMIVGIGITVLAAIARFIIVKKLIVFSSMQYIQNVIIPIVCVSALSIILPFVLSTILQNNFFCLCVIVTVSIVFTGISIYTVGLKSSERKMVKAFVKARLTKGL
jgi:O-antigen/teichoic acid export membrane protein